MLIQITGGPSLYDATDASPIWVQLDGREVRLAAIGWRGRLGIWLVRAYVNRHVQRRKWLTAYVCRQCGWREFKRRM